MTTDDDKRKQAEEVRKRIASGNLDSLGSMPAGAPVPKPIIFPPSEELCLVKIPYDMQVQREVTQHLTYDISPAKSKRVSDGNEIYLNTNQGWQLIGKVIYSERSDFQMVIKRAYMVEKTSPEGRELIRITNRLIEYLSKNGFLDRVYDAATETPVESPIVAPAPIEPITESSNLVGQLPDYLLQRDKNDVDRELYEKVLNLRRKKHTYGQIMSATNIPEATLYRMLEQMGMVKKHQKTPEKKRKTK